MSFESAGRFSYCQDIEDVDQFVEDYRRCFARQVLKSLHYWMLFCDGEGHKLKIFDFLKLSNVSNKIKACTFEESAMLMAEY